MTQTLLIAALAVAGIAGWYACARFLRRRPIGPWVSADIQFEVRDGADLSATTVKSRKTSEVEYAVDVVGQRCTCEQFRRVHSRHPTNDVRRLCRHLALVLRRRHALVYRHEVAQVYLSCGPMFDVPPPPDRFLEARSEGGALVYVGVGRRRWIEVFVRTRSRRGGHAVSGEYRHYGFDRVEQRWSHGEAPAGARELRSLLAPLR